MGFNIFKDKKPKEKSTKKFIPKYQKPKILLVDLPAKTLNNVQSVGFNALAGTFGSPFKVTLSDEYRPVIGAPLLPNFTEQEIIFVDLTPPPTIDGPESEKKTSQGVTDWYAKCSVGVIDPRPKFMYLVQKHYDRILEHGGLFIIFSQPRLSQELVLGMFSGYSFKIDREIPVDNWSFLSILSQSNLSIEGDFGEEMSVPDYDAQIFRFLRKIIKDGRYTATFSPTYEIKENWISILSNKFGRCIGGLIVPKDSKGRVLILPQISKKPEAVVTLLREVLPDISPHLFPHIEGVRWVERDEYELDSILKYKLKRFEVQKKANSELEEIDKKILEERTNQGFLHGIITQTNTNLVKSVKKSLKLLEFNEIMDVDEEIESQNIPVAKQEDLQIHDNSPTLLVEIKGLSGLPRESDTLQVIKYVPRRMKEWDRTDVRGISIINHQRNVPALERNNEHAFTNQQISDAINQDITLLTTWDLFLLIKGMQKWQWNPNVIRQLFYKNGRMSRIPIHYKAIGKIFNYWENSSVIGVDISDNTLKKEDRIGYIVPEGYLEEDILSIQVEKKDVEKAVSGQQVGIKTIYPKKVLHKGMTVYKVMELE